MKTVLFVVPVYNDWDRLESLLNSFYRALELDKEKKSLNNKYQICVVDNGSTDTTELPKKYPNVLWLEEETPGSYSARNKAISSCSADYYYFTDSDCLLDKRIFSVVERVTESDKEIDIIGGRVKLYPETKGEESIFEAYDLITGLDQERYIAKGTAITANLLVAKRVIDRIGAFDTSRFSGGDADFAQRAVRSGIGLVFNNELVVYHPARKRLFDFSEKVKRITGAQVQRFGRIKAWILIPFIFLLLIRDWKRTVSFDCPLKIKLMSVLASVVIFYVRQKYALYFLFGGRNLQR
ncbi:glycosyltransferase [Idiomarina abyssalis]|uniref:glycosyltransferase family 2 protein n=1 Tax=Idiomarina abyssalis TaxID=86102 RepID=UPI002300DD94|nr:glycosyltransferase [Idiomarina abyssalis]MDA6067160.1 glycosyltransferase [Idiomarina abyssalis]